MTKQVELIDPIASIELIRQYLRTLQTRICQMVEQEDGSTTFHQDPWEYSGGGGGGLTCVLEKGAVIEKAGVNFSQVSGTQLPQAATQQRMHLQDSKFQAIGISVVIHPVNPYVPTTHANVRFIVVEKPGQAPYWWFGGGFDLTPYYGFIEDCQHWHQMAKAACDPFGENIYPDFKRWCDQYFYLKHRQEARGIGGIFFDDLNNIKDPCWTFANCFSFMQAVGEQFIKAYQPILTARKHNRFTDRERDFQAYRRGRYVEFNLIYDRGTLFGLQSGGRTESILMSLPPIVKWRYDWHPEPGSAEAKLYEDFLKAREWV